MFQCPNCQCLVADNESVCPACRLDLQQYQTRSKRSPAATVALTPEQMADLARLPCPHCSRQISLQDSQCPHCGQPVTPKTPPAHDVTPARNPAARLAFILTFCALVPFFPIALAALVLGILGLGASGPGDPSRSRAWTGIVGGGLLGLIWITLTVWWFLGRPG